VVSAYRLRADRERCIGAGQCMRVAAGLFDQDEREGLVVVLVEQLDSTQLDAARTAERQCPARAISIEQT
jgi:ferredoxin